MSRPLRVAMLTHSTLPRGGVVDAMSLSEALEDLGIEIVLHAPDSAGRGFFRKPRCAAITFPVKPAPREAADMVEQRIDDYVRWFRRPENRGFDLYHAHDGIGANALATLDGAVAGATSPIERRPAFYFRGHANLDLGNYAQAARDFDAALALIELGARGLLDAIRGAQR